MRQGKRQTVARSAVAVMAFAVIVAGCGDDDDDDTSTAESGPPVSLEGRVNDHGTEDLGSETSFALELDDSYFGPTYIEAAPGSTVTVTLENEGDAPHTFTIDDLNIDEEVGPGESATVEVELPDEGALAFYCRFHVGGGMQGAFVVSGGAAGGGGTGRGTGTTSGGGGSPGGY